MSNQSYLIFTLNSEHFAIAALSVKEIISLPELIFEEEVPAFIAGAFNLRGKIVHVIDLNLCLGHKPERYQVTDRVVILELSPHPNPLPQGERESSIVPPPLTGGGEGEGVSDIRTTHDERRLFGVIVNDVLDVIPISPDDIEEAPEHHFVAGEAKVGEEIVMVIDHNNLLESWELGVGNHPIPSPTLPLKGREFYPLLQGEGQGEGGYFFSSSTPDEKVVFHERALNLMKAAVEEADGLVALAVFGLNGEYYGAELEAIREFSDVRNVTPVPCTPAHILGDMNLRGDILTIVDIKGMLNIPAKSTSKGKVVVAGIDDLLVGIAVDEVFEVINLTPSDIRPVPSAVEGAGQEYIKGEAPYNQKMMSILDLKKILTKEELVVKE